MADDVLTMELVGRRYSSGGPWALRDVSLRVPAGTFVAVMGATGSGKSTPLRGSRPHHRGPGPRVAQGGRPAGGTVVMVTARKRQILALLAEGRSNAAIADRLTLAGRSVENM